MSIRIRATSTFLALILAAGCSRTPSPPVAPAAIAPTATPVAPVAGPRSLWFRDVTATTGITFVHSSGMDPQKYYPSSLGSGVALIDYDGDGRLDIYFCSARPLPLSADNPTMGNRLYRNLGGMRFEDVTDRAKVGYHGYCHGAAVGDIDNDGDSDLYITTYGGNVLFVNNGDGTFHDATAGSGVGISPWSTGAAFLDYDNDGKLDLYVSRYGQWTEAGPHDFCGDRKRNIRVICSPYSIRPERHLLFRGKGDGTFTETTQAAGVSRRDGRGLGIMAADLNRDGKTDLYVANDGCPNFLFFNKGDGTFTDATEISGAATDAAGKVQGSMGVDAQDVDGDGKPELFVTNFRGEYDTLYLNVGDGNFQDISAQSGIVRDSLAYVKWGCALADFDNDGWADMFVVSGEVDDNLRSFGQANDFEQPVVVWRNQGKGRFRRVSDPGPFASRNYAGRGAAFGDLDDDGDLDVVFVVMDKAPVVLANESPNPGHWVRFALEGSTGNRDAIGATVEVHAGGHVFQRLIKGGDSYLSVNDRRALVGLGSIDRVDRVEILWPGGKTTTIDAPEIDKTHRVKQPAGG